ncbi:MAG: ABC transporter permease [Pseudoflavonifractor sp.]|nr:ABC transporter permease [Alloprevotella sp.]MCM1116788.1 ABC transporter permease [Pseudoflavonifractor sp.]
MLDLINEISQTLSNNRLRTILTGISVAWGIFMLIILVSISKGVFNSFESNMSSSTSATIEIYQGRTTMAHGGYKEGRFVRLNVRDIPQIIAAHPEMVEEVHTTISVDSAKVETPTDYTAQGLYGVFPGSHDLRRAKMIAGRTLNRLDNDSRRKVILMEKRNADLLFGSPEAAIGQTVKSLGLAWTVVGVFSHDWQRENYVPFNTLMQLANNGDGYVWRLSVVAPGMKDEKDGEALEKGLRATLAGIHNFDPEDTGAVWLYNRFTSYLSSKAGLGYLDIAIWVIGILTMLSGIIGVSNIMFVSVRERTHEIGIRRAIGAKPRSIMGQVVAESVVITTLFGYIGVVMGMAVTQLAAKVIAANPTISQGIKDPTVDLAMAVKVTIVLIISGALAGLAPAIKATKVKPVEALRDE